jgi:hypothetical protein
MTRYAVSIVLTKQEWFSTRTSNYLAIFHASSKEEAIGKCIKTAMELAPGYQVGLTYAMLIDDPAP